MSNVTPASGTTAGAIGSVFAGVQVDTTSNRLVLPNGNQLIYPSNRVRQQPSAGPTSIVTFGAVFQRSSLKGALGFAIYTDAPTNATTFKNGYVVLFEYDGYCRIYSVSHDRWKPIYLAQYQVKYPLDLHEHAFTVSILSPSTNSLQIYVYGDTTIYAAAVLTPPFVLNGTIGFTLIEGADPAYITPGSIIYESGVPITNAAVASEISTIENEFDANGNLIYQYNTPVTKSTIASASGADGSFLQSGVVSGRHLSGGASSDTSALMGSGTLLYSRHATPLTSVIAASTGIDGLYLNANQVSSRHVVTGAIQAQHITGGTTGDTAAVMGGSALLMTRHATPVTTVIASSTGSDGLFLNPNQVSSRHVVTGSLQAQHLSGGTPGDNTAVMGGSTLLMSRHAVPVTTVIATSTGSDGLYLNPSQVSSRHIVTGAVQVQHLTGGAVGDTSAFMASATILHTRHSAPVTTIIAASTGSDGLYMNPNQVSSRHVVTGSLQGQHLAGGSAGDTSNLMDGAQRFNHIRMSAGVQMVISSGGALLISNFPNGVMNASGALSGTNGVQAVTTYLTSVGTILNSQMSIAKGVSGDLAGIMIGATGAGYRLALDGTGNIRIQTFIAGASATVSGFAGATKNNDTGYHRYTLIVAVGSGSNTVEAIVDGTNYGIFTDTTVTLGASAGTTSYTGVSGLLNFFQYTSSPEPYTAQHLSIRSTVSPTSGAEGSYVQPGVVSGRHLVGGVGTDTGALLGSGTLLYTRHTPSVTATIASASGTDGSYVQPGVITGRHLVGGLASDTGALLGSGTVLYTRHALPLTSVIAATTGVDGLYLSANQVSSRHVVTGAIQAQHIVGGTPGDTATVMSGSALLHSRHSPGVQTVIASGGTFNAGLPTTGTILPLVNHPVQITTVISATTGAEGLYLASNQVSSRHVVTGTIQAQHIIGGTPGDTSNMMSGSALLMSRHATPVTTVIASTTGSDGLFLNPSQVSSRHVVTGAIQAQHLTGGTPGDTNPLLAGAGLVYTRHASGVIATIAGVSGTDGSFVNPGVISGRHLSGGASTDTSALMSSGTNTLLMTRHATPVTTVIASSTGSDGLYLNPNQVSSRHVVTGAINVQHLNGGLNTDTSAVMSGSALLHSRHSPGVQAVIVSGGTFNANLPTTGTILPLANHAGQVTTVIAATTGADGLFLNPNQVSSRHVVTGSLQGQHFSGGTAGDTSNLMDGSQRLNHVRMSAGVQTVISSGGLLLVSNFPNGTLNASGALSGTNGVQAATTYPITGALLNSQMSIAKGVSGDLAGIMIGTSSAGYRIALDGTGNVRLQTFIAGASGTVSGFSGATKTNDTGYHSYNLIVGVGASSNTVEALIDGINYGVFTDSTVTLSSPCGTTSYTGVSGLLNFFLYTASPEPYSSQHTSIKSTVAATTGADGSFVQPGVISGRHLSGAATNDTSPLMSSGSNTLLYSRHAAGVTTVIASGGTFNASLPTTGTILPLTSHFSTVVATAASQLNLIPDSDNIFGFGPYGYWNTPPAHFYWSPYYGFQSVYLNVPTGGTSGTIFYTLSNAPYITVGPYNNYTLSCVANTSAASSTGSSIALIAQLSSGFELGRITVPTGVNFVKYSTTFNVGSGSAVKLIMAASGAASDFNTNLFFSQMQLEMGSVASGYKPNLGFQGTNSGLLHGAMSVQTSTVIGGATGTEGLYLNSNQISSRHVVTGAINVQHLNGGLNTDTSAFMNGALLLHTRHSTPVTTVVASTTGSDGLYLNANQVSSRHVVTGAINVQHLNGGLNTDTSAFMNGALLLHTRHSTPVTTVVASTTGSDGLYLNANQVSSRHVVTGAINVQHLNGGLNTDTTAFMSGAQILMSRHAAPVTTVIASSTGSDGLFLNPNQVSSRHVVTGTIQVQHLVGGAVGDTAAFMASGNILHTRHSAQLLQVVSNVGGNGQLNVNPTGGVTSTLPQLNHDPAVLSGSTGTTYNLITDPALQFSTPGSSTSVYWLITGSGILAQLNVNNLGLGTGFQYVGNGSPAGYNLQRSKVINVIPGLTYNLSCYIDASHVTSGSPYIAVYNPGVTGYAYLTVAQTAGVSSRVSSTIVMPTGVNQVVVILDTANATVANGQGLAWVQPQFQLGSYVTAFESAMIVDPNVGKHDYSSHASQVTTVIASSTGSDGLYLNSSQVSSRHVVTGAINVQHLNGGLNTDTSAVMSGSALLHSRHSPGVQAVIVSGGTFNANLPTTGTILPLANHAGQVTTVIAATTGTDGLYLNANQVSSRHVVTGAINVQHLNGGLNTDTTAVMSGSALLHTRHSPGVQAVILSGGTFNANLPTTGTILPLTAHDLTVQATAASPVNLVPDSDIHFGVGTNTYWNTLPANYVLTTYYGYAAIFYNIQSGSGAAFYSPATQAPYIPVVGGAQYTLSALFDTTDGISSATNIALILAVGGGSEIGRITANGSGTRVKLASTFTIPSTASTVELTIVVNYVNADAGKDLGVGQFQLEFGTVASGYRPNLKPHAAGGLIHGAMSTQTSTVISGATGSDGLYLNSGQVSSRHVVTGAINVQHLNGGLNTDASAFMSGTQILMSRHALPVTTVIASSTGSDGLYMNPNQVSSRHVVTGTIQAQHLTGGSAGDTSAILSASALVYARHNPAVTATIASTTGSDGIYLNSNQVSSRHIVTGTIQVKHLIGGTNTDASAFMNGGTLLYTRHDTSVQTVIASGGTYNTALATAGTNLPFANHAQVAQQRHTIMGQCLGSPPTVISGTLTWGSSGLLLVRGSGTNSAGAGTCTVPGTAAAIYVEGLPGWPGANYGIFVPWAAGTTVTGATPIAIAFSATGAAGTGYNATSQSPNYELLGVIAYAGVGAINIQYVPSIPFIQSMEGLYDWDYGSYPTNNNIPIYSGSWPTGSWNAGTVTAALAGTTVPGTLTVSGALTATSFSAGSSTYGPLSLAVNSGSLGATANNTAGTSLQVLGTSANQDSLNMVLYRQTSGSSWSSAAWRIYHNVDSTAMQFIDFENSGDIAFGTGVIGSSTAWGKINGSGYQIGSSTYGSTSATVNGNLTASSATINGTLTATGTTTLTTLAFGTTGSYYSISQNGSTLAIGPATSYSGALNIYAAGQFNSATAIFSTGGNLSVTGIFSSSIAGAFIQATSAGTSNSYAQIGNSGGTSYWGQESSTGGSIYTNAPAYAAVIGTNSSKSFVIATNNTAQVVIASNGNMAVSGSITTGPNNITGAGFFTNGGNSSYGDSGIVMASGNYINFAQSGTAQRINQNGNSLYLGPTGTATGNIVFYANGQSNSYSALITPGGTFTTGSSTYGATSSFVNGTLAVTGTLSVTGTTTLGTPLGVTSGGTGGSIGPGSALTADTGAISNSDTILLTNSLGSASLAAGTTFIIKLQGTCTSTASNTSTFTVRFGTGGNTSDTTIATFTLTSSASGSATPFDAEIMLTIRTTGTGTNATNYGVLRVTNNLSNVGIIVSTGNVVTASSSGFNSNISSGILSVSYKASASTTSVNFHNGIILCAHY